MDETLSGGTANLLRMVCAGCRSPLAFVALAHAGGSHAIAVQPAAADTGGLSRRDVEEVVRQLWPDPDLRAGRVVVRTVRPTGRKLPGRAERISVAVVALGSGPEPWGIVGVADGAHHEYGPADADLLRTAAVRLSSYLRARSEVPRYTAAAPPAGGSLQTPPVTPPQPEPPGRSPGAGQPTQAEGLWWDVGGAAGGGAAGGGAAGGGAAGGDAGFGAGVAFHPPAAPRPFVTPGPGIPDCWRRGLEATWSPAAPAEPAEREALSSPAALETAPYLPPPVPPPAWPESRSWTTPFRMPGGVPGAGRPGGATSGGGAADLAGPRRGLVDLDALLGRTGRLIGSTAGTGAVVVVVALELVGAADPSADRSTGQLDRVVRALRAELRFDDPVTRIGPAVLVATMARQPGAPSATEIAARLAAAVQGAADPGTTVQSAVVASDPVGLQSADQLVRWALDSLGPQP